jgi:ATPase subunit of ABC transporter with duplicated ATPase domains
MEILAQRREPDAGEVVMRKGTRLAFLAQDSQFAQGETVRTVIRKW